jgi:hypothetical protein
MTDPLVEELAMKARELRPGERSRLEVETFSAEEVFTEARRLAP